MNDVSTHCFAKCFFIVGRPEDLVYFSLIYMPKSMQMNAISEIRLNKNEMVRVLTDLDH